VSIKQSKFNIIQHKIIIELTTQIYHIHFLHFGNNVFVTGLHFKMQSVGSDLSYQHTLFVDSAQSISKRVIRNPVVNNMSN